MSTALVPVPGTDLVPDGWCESTVVPWLREQSDVTVLNQASARLAGLEAAYKTLNADTLELVKAADREAQVDSAIADTRYHRDLAEGAKVSATEAVRNLRSQINAVQSIGAAIREEMRLAS